MNSFGLSRCEGDLTGVRDDTLSVPLSDVPSLVLDDELVLVPAFWSAPSKPSFSCDVERVFFEPARLGEGSRNSCSDDDEDKAKDADRQTLSLSGSAGLGAPCALAELASERLGVLGSDGEGVVVADGETSIALTVSHSSSRSQSNWRTAPKYQSEIAQTILNPEFNPVVQSSYFYLRHPPHCLAVG